MLQVHNTCMYYSFSLKSIHGYSGARDTHVLFRKAWIVQLSVLFTICTHIHIHTCTLYIQYVIMPAKYQLFVTFSVQKCSETYSGHFPFILEPRLHDTIQILFNPGLYQIKLCLHSATTHNQNHYNSCIMQNHSAMYCKYYQLQVLHVYIVFPYSGPDTHVH